MIRTESLTFTVGTSVANAAGTFLTSQPISGEVIELRLAGTNLGATAVYTLTRKTDGGTVIGPGTYAAPWTKQVTNVGSVAGVAYNTPGIPVDDYLQLEVSKGVASATDTLRIYYRQ